MTPYLMRVYRDSADAAEANGDVRVSPIPLLEFLDITEAAARLVDAQGKLDALGEAWREPRHAGLLRQWREAYRVLADCTADLRPSASAEGTGEGGTGQ